jgi:uncharacterized membrane protein
MRQTIAATISLLSTLVSACGGEKAGFPPITPVAPIPPLIGVGIAGAVGNVVEHRAIAITGSAQGLTPDNRWRIELTLDPGTASSQTVSYEPPGAGNSAYPLVITGPSPSGSGLRWTLFIREPFNTPAQHTARLRFIADGATIDSVDVQFLGGTPDVTYDVLPLGTLGGSDSFARDVNQSGSAAGWASDATGRKRAVVWSSSTGAPSTLSTTDAVESQAYAINHPGTAVGSVTTAPGAQTAALWRNGTETTFAPGLTAVDVSNGDIALVAPTGPTMPGYGYLYENGTLTSFAPCDQARGCLSVWPRVLNDLRQVVGELRSTYSPPMGIGWNITFTLPVWDASCGEQSGTAIDVDDHGRVLGVATQCTAWPRVSVIQHFTSTIDLSAAIGATADPTSVIALSEESHVLAWSRSSGAFVWQNGRTTRVRLGLTGWTLDTVTAINVRGQIVAHGTGPGGITRALLLTPR